MSQSFDVFPRSCFVSSFCVDEDLITLSPLSLQRLTETLPISHASTSSYYIPFSFKIHTWTWLKSDDYQSRGFNWPPWDQIAGSVNNTNGHQIPLTSPSVHCGLWWLPVRRTKHTGQLSNLWAISHLAGHFLQRKASKQEAGRYQKKKNPKEPNVQIPPKNRTCINDTQFIGNGFEFISGIWLPIIPAIYAVLKKQ